MEDLTLIIPAKEEPNSLPLVIDEIKNLSCKKIIVMRKEDHKTYDAIKNLDCEILFQSSFGYGNAIIEGIKNAKTNYIAIFYADGSTDPKYLTLMMKKLLDENLSIVFGSRYEKNGGSLDDNILTKFGNFLFTAFGNIFFQLNITDILFTYFIGKKKALDEMNLVSNNYNLCAEIPIKAKKNKLKYSTYPCIERKRIADKKKVKEFKVGFQILFFMIKKLFTRSNQS